AVQDPDTYPFLYFWDDYFVSLGASSAATINTETRKEAMDPALTAIMDGADAIFIRGGDQSRYMAFWRDTPIHDQLIAAHARGALIGGSSAGAAMLGQPMYDGRIGSAVSYEVLLDPHDPYITFDTSLVSALDNLIVDTHFTERGRLGRLAVFALRAPFAAGSPGLGLGIDPRTAAFVHDDGTMDIVGRGSVTVLDPRPGVATLDKGVPPAIDRMRFWQLPAGYRIDLEAFRADPGSAGDPIVVRPDYVVPGPAAAAAIGPLPSMALDGDSAALREDGELTLGDLDSDRDNWRNGLLTLAEGNGALPGVLLVTRLFDDSDLFENHVGGMMWAVAQRPDIVAVGVDLYLDAGVAPPSQITAPADSYALVIDARRAAYVGVPPDGAWQTAAIEGG
ncbi:MAG: cyanophycinase, partial [Myxococcota bacterium]